MDHIRRNLIEEKNHILERFAYLKKLQDSLRSKANGYTSRLKKYKIRAEAIDTELAELDKTA